ncbi:MAG TPA: aldolase/citrate lyase family protein [Burkholderiales bacterium]|jgi:4-hydroxy-2-oxoheptanedioate aldolase|nr:aldolase/citrate lyase family protein [Burkholderiales bacterium]
MQIVNAAKARLAKGEIAIGMGIRGVRGVEVARLMKTAGYDWLFIDLEHGATSTETASAISVAALDAGIAPFVRVPHGELAMGTRCLDAGALGIVVPHVDTADVARAMVDAFKFRPLGHRSIGGAYPQFGFASRPVNEVVTELNEATMIVAMIETPQAVENAEKIAAVHGIDALLMGTNDLCLEMGIPGKIDDARIVAAMDTLIAACRKHGKYPALGGVYTRDLMKRYLARGMRMVLAGNDIGLLLNAAQDQASFVRACQ